MQLSSSDIEELNSDCPSGQGIFIEPNGILNHIKEPVVYMRWISGGMRGGNCYGDKAHRYDGEGKPPFKALNLVLKKLKPEITYLEFREVEELVETNETSEWEYYGNSSEYSIEYILLSDLYKTLRML